jgi:hypothetical protein
LSFATIGPAPAIPRLNISAYQFGTECLSGDVEAGDATSFPMSIGMVRRRNISTGRRNDYTGQGEHISGRIYPGIEASAVGVRRGGKNRRALLARNVKQLKEIRLNEDLLLKI